MCNMTPEERIARSRDEWKELSLKLLEIADYGEMLVYLPFWAVYRRFRAKREFKRLRKRFTLAELPDGLSES